MQAGNANNAINPSGSIKFKFLVTVEDAAEALSLSRTRIFALLKDEQLSSVKVGGLRRIPITALQDYVEQLTSLQKVG